ncbi:MAG: ABC transporter permease [Lachnospiraceae bacterium]|nr:ABC transporter permease [Lachnospiraceae bacterium]
MLKKTIYAETKKLTGNPVWIPFFILPLLSTLIGTLNFTNNLGLLSNTWENLWTQNTLFLSYFFFPALVATCCAFLWRMEFFEHNMNLFLTVPVRRSSLILGKYMIAVCVTILSVLWTLLLYLLSGWIIGIPQGLPKQMPEWILCGILGSVTICSVQLFLSLLIQSFAVPIGIALAGGVLGIGFLSKGLANFWPYALFAYGLRANNPDMKFEFLPFLASNLIFTVLFLLLTVRRLKKR